MSVYLHLFHGRNDPAEEMVDWGLNGPTIGPLDYVHTTYGTDIKLGADEETAEKFGLDPAFPALGIHEGLVVYDGKYFGDWSVSTEKCTGFYEIRMFTPPDTLGTTSGTLNLTYHEAIELFDSECEADGVTVQLFDVGSSEPVLIKEHTNG